LDIASRSVHLAIHSQTSVRSRPMAITHRLHHRMPPKSPLPVIVGSSSLFVIPRTHGPTLRRTRPHLSNPNRLLIVTPSLLSLSGTFGSLFRPAGVLCHRFQVQVGPHSKRLSSPPGNLISTPAPSFQRVLSGRRHSRKWTANLLPGCNSRNLLILSSSTRSPALPSLSS